MREDVEKEEEKKSSSTLVQLETIEENLMKREMNGLVIMTTISKSCFVYLSSDRNINILIIIN